MDVDPLSDTVPPRYAIESDDEEDEEHPLGLHSQQNVSADGSQNTAEVQVKIQGDAATFARKPLLVASGDAGTFFAKGAALGEQTAAVGVGGTQIGLVFNPSWAPFTVLISEALSRLPLYAMHPYAKAVLDAFEPTNLALFDTYAVPTYATDTPTSTHDAPLCYLSTATSLSELKFLSSSPAQPFSPPNLLQSTTASFLSLSLARSISNPPSTTPTPAQPDLLLLLPTPHIPTPAPKTLTPADITHVDAADEPTWSAQMMNDAQSLALTSLGLDPGAHAWALKDTSNSTVSAKARARRNEVGEGGMYI